MGHLRVSTHAQIAYSIGSSSSDHTRRPRPFRGNYYPARHVKLHIESRCCISERDIVVNVVLVAFLQAFLAE